MSFVKNLKYRFINAFREVFLYHYSSLEFRAKLFACVISANKNFGECEFEVVKNAGALIYSDEARISSLEYTTKEYVQKVVDENGLNNDMLIEDVLRDLKDIPRYAKKIDTDMLKTLIKCHHDTDTKIYQKRIIELFNSLKEEYSSKK